MDCASGPSSRACELRYTELELINGHCAMNNAVKLKSVMLSEHFPDLNWHSGYTSSLIMSHLGTSMNSSSISK